MAMNKTAAAGRLTIRRGLGEAEAALYIGLGASKFRQLVVDGRMPRPRLIDGRRVWDVTGLDAAFLELPIEGQQDQDDNPWH